MIGLLTALGVLGVLVPLVIGYAHWLGTIVEAPHERKNRIRDTLDEKEFSSDGISFRIDNVMFSEKQSYRYKLLKFIPFVRRLDGKTIVTLRSNGGEIAIRADGFGPTEYLNGTLKSTDRLRDGHPDFECDRDYGGSDSAKLKIESWDVSPLLGLLEEIPTYLHETLSNYPGNSEYNLEE